MNTGTLPSGHAMTLSHLEIRATVNITGDPPKIEPGGDGEGLQNFT